MASRSSPFMHETKHPGLSEEALNSLNWEVSNSILGVADCSICLESLTQGDKLICLSCQHRFHAACLDPWLQTCGDCPYCQRAILLNNGKAVMLINNDLKTLGNFADDRFHSTGLSEIYKDGSFRSYLLEAWQLINLLSSSQPENFMNPVIREKNYNTLDYKKVATILENFKDSADGIFGSLSNRNTKMNARKKSIDMLKKRLKYFG